MGRKKGTGIGSPDGGKTRPERHTEWEKEREDPRPPEWRKTTGGKRQGVGFGIELPRGTNNPGVEELSWGDNTFRMTLEGNRVPGADLWGRGGDRHPSATQDTKDDTKNSRGEDMASRLEPAVPSSAPHGTSEVGGKGTTQRNSNGANSARPEYGAIVRHEYSLLDSEEPTGKPSSTRPRGAETTSRTPWVQETPEG